MISAERTSEIFKCLTLYYSGKYDYYKYNARLRKQPVDVSHSYRIIAEKYDTPVNVERFFNYNIINKYTQNSGIQNSIQHYTNKECYEHYKSSEKYLSNFEKNFAEYVKTRTRFKALIESENNQPLIIVDTIQRKIPIDILSYMLYFYKTLKDKLNSNDPLIAETLDIASKYGIFLAKNKKIHTDLTKIVMNLDK